MIYRLVADSITFVGTNENDSVTDGSQKTIGQGESYTIPLGHDAWVEGANLFVAIEVMSIARVERWRAAQIRVTAVVM